ncbi:MULTISPECIES: putative hemolysin [Rahnella]
MANPAAVYCHERGGRSVSVQTPHGVRADCVFPDGRGIDEWELYRRDHN